MKSLQGNLLVVDDNENNRDLLCRRLRRQGYSAVPANDGVHALEILRSNAFDLVLLDVMMPQMDGYEVLRHLKNDPALRHIPVIMISALDDMESVVRCIELGAEDYLSKPFNPVLLQARIDASLEKKRLRDQEQEYMRRVRQELELGRRTQADFLPATLPQPPGWQIAAAFHPAREIAGDFYDAFELPYRRIGLVLCDVCDKGVGAALFMALIRSLLRAFAEQGGEYPDQALGAVALTNDYIARHHHQNGTHTFATLFFGILDPTDGTLTYVNGGHPSPLLTRNDGSREMLDPTGPAVGMMAKSRFAIATTRLNPGDWLIAYTDGITEARRPSGELFGEERMLALFDQPDQPIETLMNQVEARVYDFTGHRTLEDDITLLAMYRFAA